MSKYYTYSPNLIGRHKTFNQKLHDKYDLPARKVIKEQLKDWVMDNPDTKKQDLIITKPYKYKFIEIQVCSFWEQPKYPHKNLYIYERKAKYGNDTLFITLNKILTRGYIFDRKSLCAKPRRIQKYSREFVYDIPWRLTIPIYIENLSVETIKLY